MKRSARRIYIRPQFLHMPEIYIDKKGKTKEEIEEEAKKQRRSQKAVRGHNAAHFYDALYAAIFGGKERKPYSSKEDKHINGDYDDLHPDVVREDELGIHDTETKCVSFRSSQLACKCNQVRQYLEKGLLRRLRERDKQPSVDYAYFTYGYRDSGPLPLNNRKMAGILSKETRRLVILPFNLAILQFLGSRVQHRNQESAGNSMAEAYYMPGDMTFLLDHPPDEVIPYLLKEIVHPFIQDDAKKYLALDGFHQERFESPDNLYFRDVKIKPFQITRYYQPDPSQWLKNVRRNYKDILKRIPQSASPKLPDDDEHPKDPF